MNTAVPWSKSLSVKVLGIFLLALTALLFTVWLTLGASFQRMFSDGIKPYFTRHLISLQNQVGVPPDLDVAKKITQDNSAVTIEVQAPQYRWSSSKKFIDIKNLDVQLQRVGAQGLLSEAGFHQGNFVMRTYEQGYTITFILAKPLNASSDNYSMWLVLGATVIVFSLLYLAISRLLNPVLKAERGIRRIGGGDVSYRLEVDRQDEMGSLARSINKMANNIEEMLETKRHMLLAISHELRTPITRAKIGLSMLDDEVIKDSVIEDLDEMETMIHELLESERLRGNHAPLSLHRININEVIYQVQGRYFEDEPLILALDEHIPDLLVDASRIGLAVKNVIKNALTASQGSNSKVIVTTHADDRRVLVSISDSGEGIAAKDLPRLTEPFYRPDSSRQRKTGGFGIGLYLIKAIMDAHHGEMHIDSGLNLGTTVTLIFPARPHLYKSG